MKPPLLVYVDERALGGSELEDRHPESAQLEQERQSSELWLTAGPPHPLSTTPSVMVPDGKSLVTDGQFALTGEQPGSSCLIEGRDLAEVFGFTGRIPRARVGIVENLLLMEIAGMREN